MGEGEHSHGNVDGDRSHSSSPSDCPLPGLGGFPAAPGYKSLMSEGGTSAVWAPGPQPDPSGGPKGPRRDLHLQAHGPVPSPVPMAWARLVLWPSVPAQQWQSLWITPWEQGRWQTGRGTKHDDSVGWDCPVRPGRDRSDPQTPFPFHCPASTRLFLLLPAAQPWGAPPQNQHHSPRPPTPSPPTPRPPTRSSLGEHQQGQTVGQCLTRSSPSPKCAHPSSGSPAPSMLTRGSITPAPPL